MEVTVKYERWYRAPKAMALGAENQLVRFLWRYLPMVRPILHWVAKLHEVLAIKLNPDPSRRG